MKQITKKMNLCEFERVTKINMDFENWSDVVILSPGQSVNGVSGDNIKYADVSCPVEDIHDMIISMRVVDADGDECDIPMSCSMLHDGTAENISVLVSEIEDRDWVEKNLG